LASAILSNQQFVEMIAQELFAGVEKAVQSWMSEVDSALESPRLTTLGRLQAIREIMDRYKQATGKMELAARSSR
jgi:hypothetical protein